MRRLSDSLHRPPLQITHGAMARLVDYDWPGNVRELENILTQAMVRIRDGVLTPDGLPLRQETRAAQASPPRQNPFRTSRGRLLSLDELEAQHIQRVLDETGYHKGRTCEVLGISRPALERKIHKYDLRLHHPAVE
jgi:DNA-binding NtrC family response regulator